MGSLFVPCGEYTRNIALRGMEKVGIYLQLIWIDGQKSPYHTRITQIQGGCACTVSNTYE